MSAQSDLAHLISALIALGAGIGGLTVAVMALAIAIRAAAEARKAAARMAITHQDILHATAVLRSSLVQIVDLLRQINDRGRVTGPSGPPGPPGNTD